MFLTNKLSYQTTKLTYNLTLGMPTCKKSTYRFPQEGFLLGSPQEAVLEAKDGPLSCWEYLLTGCSAHPAI